MTWNDRFANAVVIDIKIMVFFRCHDAVAIHLARTERWRLSLLEINLLAVKTISRHSIIVYFHY